jgi:hypothetical protein
MGCSSGGCACCGSHSCRWKQYHFCTPARKLQAHLLLDVCQLLASAAHDLAQPPVQRHVLIALQHSLVSGRIGGWLEGTVLQTNVVKGVSSTIAG